MSPGPGRLDLGRTWACMSRRSSSTTFSGNGGTRSCKIAGRWNAYGSRSAFVEVGSYAPGDSPEAVLHGIAGHGELIGVEMNHVETMVLEAGRP